MKALSAQRVITDRAVAGFTALPLLPDDNVNTASLPRTGFVMMDWGYGDEARHATRLDERLMSVGFRIYRPKGGGSGPALLDAEAILNLYRPSGAVSGQLLAPAGDSGVLQFVRSRIQNIGRDTTGAIVDDPLMQDFKRVDAIIVFNDFTNR